MTLELLLARRLLEAAADPYAPPRESEDAASELAEVAMRRGDRMLRLASYEGLRAADLSPVAWLLVLESADADDPEPPAAILDALCDATEDEIVRLRLVSAALGHPLIRERYAAALAETPQPEAIERLPPSWPHRRIAMLQALVKEAERPHGASASAALAELVLYLLQDGSPPALALAAAAVTPEEAWRRPAHELARGIVRGCDPELSGYGRAFRRARI
jgi:hypothetical protein